jgi:hypothetical protein
VIAITSSVVAHETEQDAALALLKDTTSILESCGVQFVVVGGWVPYLFHRHLFGHPGTFDVDVLLHSSSLEDNSFDNAAERLLESGYLRAVKNKFQAHRVLRVQQEDLVFHVDFLNESNQGEQLSIVGGKGRLHSIYTEAMQAVFKYTPFRSHESLPGLKFPSPETFIASKAAATLVKKRTRDAFDAFITASDQDADVFAETWRELQSDGLFHDANDNLIQALHEGDAIQKIQSQLESLGAQVPERDEILGTFSFLVD